MKFKDFLIKAQKPLIFLISCIGLIFLLGAISDQVQKDWGKVYVEEDSFILEDTVLNDIEGFGSTIGGHYVGANNKKINYKLYVPKVASKDNKLPAVLLLHGYQNDHETCDAYAIELSKRGYVVLAIDEYGHGYTEASLVDRGYVKQKVTVNYGDEDTDAFKVAVESGEKDKGEGWATGLGGPTRYFVMMNFSNLTIFDDMYNETKDATLLDSSMGGIAAYAFLSSLDFVDNTKLAVSGHSMGTWASWTVVGAFEGTPIEPKALVLQCGEVFESSAYDHTNISNVLMLQAKWDEFNYFRDYIKETTNDSILEKGKVRYNFLNRDGKNGETADKLEFNETYGDFSDGSARRVEFLYTNHRLTTHNTKGLKAAISWIDSSVGHDSEERGFSYRIKDYFMFAATLIAIVSMFALMQVLVQVPFFASIVQALPTKKVNSGWKWWKGCLITMGIAAVTYPFMTQLGHGLLPLPDTTIFRMTIGNGFLAWYLLLIVIMLLTTILPYKSKKKKGIDIDFVDLGLSRYEHKDKLDWALFGKSLLLVLCMVGLMYLECILSQAFFMLDFRFIWPFFKGFTFVRFFQFLVYIPVFALFFILNNSKIFAQMRSKDMNDPSLKGFFKAWYKCALCMIGGILILCLIEYIPFFAGIGPGVDLLFSSTFGGPFMSLMIVFVPQVVVFSFFCTYAYRKTGSIYVGALTAAFLACWIVTGGSAIM